MTIIMFVIAAAYFVIFNRFFNVYYFGCAGIGSVFFTCALLAVATMALLGAFWKIIVIVLIIAAAGSFASSKNS